MFLLFLLFKIYSTFYTLFKNTGTKDCFCTINVSTPPTLHHRYSPKSQQGSTNIYNLQSTCQPIYSVYSKPSVQFAVVTVYSLYKNRYSLQFPQFPQPPLQLTVSTVNFPSLQFTVFVFLIVYSLYNNRYSLQFPQFPQPSLQSTVNTVNYPSLQFTVSTTIKSKPFQISAVQS